MNHSILPPQRQFHERALSPTPVYASSCGKAIIVGEHAVIYGASAVAMPISNLRMKITLKPSTKNKSSLKFGSNRVSDHVLGIIDDAFHTLNIKPFPCEIEGTSQLLIGSGLGSSAALSIVILKALARFVGKNIEESVLSHFGKTLEGRFHGKSSGLDTCVVAYEKPILFKKDQRPNIIELNHPQNISPWRFVLIDSGTRSSTMSMIKLAAPYFLDSKAGDKRLEEFDRLAINSSKALACGHFELLAESMNRASRMLEEAGLVSDLLKSMFDRIANIGLPSAKLTGAGRGGCVLGLLSPSNYEEQLQRLKKTFGEHKVYSVYL